MNILYNHRTQGKAVERVHILGVVNSLKEKGNTVDILSVPGVNINTTVFHKKRNRKLGFSPLSFLSSKVHGSIFEVFELLYNIILFFRLVYVFSTKKIDFVYERYSLYMFITVFLCKIMRKKIILEINDAVAVPRVRTCYFKFIARLIERWVLKNATGLVIISKNFRDILTSAYGDIAESVISPNAVNSNTFISDPIKAAEIRRQYALNSQMVICGYVGAFIHWHGIDWFVERIIPKMHENNNLVFLLVGDGKLFDSIKAMVAKHNLSDRIILIGRVPHENIVNYLEVMDFAIMPDSNEYGSPMKLFEYMSCGLGTVIPSYGPVVECVEDGVTGWLTSINNKNEFVDKVVSVSCDRDVFSKVGNDAIDYIKDNRQWSNNVDQLLSLVGE